MLRRPNARPGAAHAPALNRSPARCEVPPAAGQFFVNHLRGGARRFWGEIVVGRG
ncbi:hypothetical protein F8B43_0953 [Methylorubrum populi]|uniref:Uncharacterized protein n=1 Tax=Methylorubrum populi TaxID=223967 RepID=A0A833JAL2_9HYPH|nr:hypothetical protein F8B43_0953 [Methylorubrum populi]